MAATLKKDIKRIIESMSTQLSDVMKKKYPYLTPVPLIGSKDYYKVVKSNFLQTVKNTFPKISKQSMRMTNTKITFKYILDDLAQHEKIESTLSIFSDYDFDAMNDLRLSKKEGSEFRQVFGEVDYITVEGYITKQYADKLAADFLAEVKKTTGMYIIINGKETAVNELKLIDMATIRDRNTKVGFKYKNENTLNIEGPMYETFKRFLIRKNLPTKFEIFDGSFE